MLQRLRDLGSALLGLLTPLAAQDTATAHTVFEHKSTLLSAFWGRDITLRACVVLPPAAQPGEALPVCYSIHGFGGSHLSGVRRAPALVAAMAAGDEPRLAHVFLDASCPLGHHEFADSVNNGPWGQALTRELVPALEAKFGIGGDAKARFLTGHSSGGWSSLWLQIHYPESFDGTWSTAPDSVDFRDFTGVDIYTFDNAFTAPDGTPIQLVRRGSEWTKTIRQFVTEELQRKSYGGQFMSFNAVFSPRGEDGRPLPLFDPATGVIDRAVATAWRRYDIADVLRTRWTELAPRLQGKLAIYIGTLDTFRLEGACRLLAADLQRLGSDATIVFAEGRDHGSVLRPHPELWPDGLLRHIHRAMRARFDAATTAK
jgi:S-formylglutathione hydrolase FrmB